MRPKTSHFVMVFLNSCLSIFRALMSLSDCPSVTIAFANIVKISVCCSLSWWFFMVVSVSPCRLSVYNTCHLHNALTFNDIAKGRLLACKTRPFSVRLTAFWNAKDRISGSNANLLDSAKIFTLYFIHTPNGYTQPLARRSVTVIPRSDAESSKHPKCQTVQIAYTGFRVGARNDSYRPPG